MLCAKFLISSFQEGLGIYSVVHCVQAVCAEPQKCLQSGAECSAQILQHTGAACLSLSDAYLLAIIG